MESLSGTVEGLLQDNNGFEGTPPLVELTPNTMQEVFLDVWPGSIDSQEEGLAHYRVEDLLQHAGVDTQDLVSERLRGRI